MLRLILSTILFFAVSSASASMTLGATRVIYEGEKKEASISLVSKGEDIPYLVQSWVTKFGDKNKDTPFIVTPPLFKLNSDTESLIRVSYVKETLPQDRESLFSLNVSAIPAIDKNQNSRILIATKSIVKLIYRPAALSNNDAALAYEKVTAVRGNGVIQLHNPTPYYINVAMLKADGKEVGDIGPLAPFSDKTITRISNSARNISLKSINDYGGLTSERTISIKG